MALFRVDGFWINPQQVTFVHRDGDRFVIHFNGGGEVGFLLEEKDDGARAEFEAKFARVCEKIDDGIRYPAG